jgi:hypothetical protein
VLVYGDAQATIAPRVALAEIAAALGDLNASPAGLARHAATVEQFIALAGLAQGLADVEAAAAGYDELSDAQAQLLDGLRLLAIDIDRSWRSGFARQPATELAPLASLTALPWPDTIVVKRCEGYAFYGTYPETFLDAARGLPADSVVIGLRSIGTGLAPLVAAAAGTRTILTVRPTNHPFARSITAGPALETAIRSWAHRPFVIVDEGPGLSGSSFGGTADWLESLGVAPHAIIFMPSHTGDLGDRAAPVHRTRWTAADRRVRDFEQLFAPGAVMPVPDWFADITGELRDEPVDWSGGQWTAARREVATWPSREVRKYLLAGTEGRFLVKFAGLDSAARAKFARARLLHDGGFGAEPLAMRYGFVIERYVDGEPLHAVPVEHLIDYLRFRRDCLPAHARGAGLSKLRATAIHNLRLVAPAAATELAARWSEDRVDALRTAVVPVHVDARLHRWEWLNAGGRIVKTDAVDHSEAHDLVGCQDILWDVAGAAVELLDTEADRAALAQAFVDGSPDRRDLLALMGVCYLAFQMGWWSMSGTDAGEALGRRYRDKLIALLTDGPRCG